VNPLLVTIEEAAELLSIGRSHLYLLLDQGQIHSVSIGRCRRITVEEVRRFVERLAAEASP
jgi:excisionase family DNA binding protein